MTSATAEKLEQLLRDSELGWMIDLYSPSEAAVPRFLKQLDEFAAAHRKRFDERELVVLDQLEAWARKDRSQYKVTAFLQSLAVTGEPEMLQMVWCMLKGAEVQQVNLQHNQSESFNLEVTLLIPGRPPEIFRSNDIKSAALLSHFGIVKVGDRPLFKEFYPLA